MTRLAPSRLLIAAWLIVTSLSLAPSLAPAAEPKDAKPIARDIDVKPVGLPIVWRGRLVNYVFVKLKLTAASKADLAELKRKEPYFRDALVRAAARTSFVRPWDFTHVDEAAIARTMMAECSRLVGTGQIVKVAIEKSTPQRTTGLPKISDEAPPVEEAPS